MRLVRNSVEGEYYPGNLVYPGLGIGSFQQARAEHVIQSALAPHVDRISLGVVERCEDLLNPQKMQKLRPYSTDEFPASIGEKSSGSTEVGDDMPHEGLADCAGGVVAGGDEDGVFKKAVDEDDQELVALIRRQGSYNVDREGIPGPLGLDGACCLLAMAVIGA